MSRQIPMNENAIDGESFKEYIVKKIAVGFEERVPLHFFKNAHIECVADMYSDAMIIRLRSYLAGQTHKTEGVTETTHVPLTWWDHVKLEFAPVWFAAKWPVRYLTIETKRAVYVTNICPHINLPKDDRSHFVFLKEASK